MEPGEAGGERSGPGDFGIDREVGEFGTLGGTRGRGRADISAHGGWGESFSDTMAAREGRSPRSIDPTQWDTLREDYLSHMSPWDKGMRGLKGAFGMDVGPYGLAGTPAGQAMDIGAKGLGLMGGPIGGVMGMIGRGLAEISTGSNTNFGGGFGGARGTGERGTGSGIGGGPGDPSPTPDAALAELHRSLYDNPDVERFYRTAPPQDSYARAVFGAGPLQRRA
jgi:hypothetical protein